MNGSKAIVFVAISGLFIYSGCSSSSAHRKEDKKAPAKTSEYTLGLSEDEMKAILDNPRSQRMSREVEDLVRRRLPNSSFSGAVLVAKKGVILYEHYQGLESHVSKVPVTDSSSFQLASVSKTFTGMAALSRRKRKALPGRSRNQMVAGLPVPGVTVRTLLNHRSGLPNYLYFCDSLNKDKSHFLTNEEVINLMIVHKPASQYQPDRHFSYCNTNYLILSAIIEKVSGQKYADYLQQTFFGPWK